MKYSTLLSSPRFSCWPRVHTIKHRNKILPKSVTTKTKRNYAFLLGKSQPSSPLQLDSVHVQACMYMRVCVNVWDDLGQAMNSRREERNRGCQNLLGRLRGHLLHLQTLTLVSCHNLALILISIPPLSFLIN